MTTINRKQPMRPAEIDLLNQVDTNTANIDTQTERLTQEIADRTKADTTLQQNIDTESKTRADADTELQTSIDNVNAKFPVQTANIGDFQVTNVKLAMNAVSTDRILDKNITVDKLEQTIQDQLTFLQSVPMQEFGTSNMIDVPANSSTSIDINFGSTKKEAPIVLCSLRHTSGNLTCMVTGITNEKFSVTVHNLSNAVASRATVDWLAISGR